MDLNTKVVYTLELTPKEFRIITKALRFAGTAVYHGQPDQLVWRTEVPLDGDEQDAMRAYQVYLLEQRAGQTARVQREFEIHARNAGGDLVNAKEERSK